MAEPDPRPVRLSAHAHEQCVERGTTEVEVILAVREGEREQAKRGRWMYRYNLPFDGTWQGRRYAIKQVAAVVAEEPDELVVVTVYTFYF